MSDCQPLLSPPRDWPKSVPTAFINKILRGTRVRLVGATSDEHRNLLGGLQLLAHKSYSNAVAVRDRTGWSIASGFALYEIGDAPPTATGADRYVGKEHHWNVNDRGLWIDATPRADEAHAQVVLVLSALVKAPALSTSSAPKPCLWCGRHRGESPGCRGGSSAWRGDRAVNSPVVRLFALEVHQSVIHDVKDTLEHVFGSAVTVDAWMITTRAWLFDGCKEATDVKHISASTWHGLSPSRMAAFRREYLHLLQQYDGFVVTHALALSLIYEPLGKPIVAVNSCRYDQPMCWSGDGSFFEVLNASLASMHAKGQLHVLSNNKADAAYLRLGCGLTSPVVPSLCTYTRPAVYTGTRREWLLLGAESVPLSARGLLLTMRQAIPNKGGEGEPKHEWSELYAMRGVVILPYEASNDHLRALLGECADTRAGRGAVAKARRRIWRAVLARALWRRRAIRQEARRWHAQV